MLTIFDSELYRRSEWKRFINSIFGKDLSTIGSGSGDMILDTTFTGSILLDKLSGRNYGENTITTNDEITIDTTGIQDGAYAQIGLIGDGSHTPKFTSFNGFGGTQIYDNTNNMINVVVLFKQLGKLYYIIIDQYDVSDITLTSAYTSNNGLVINLQFSKELQNPIGKESLITTSPNNTVESIILRGTDYSIMEVTFSAAFLVSDTITITIDNGFLPRGYGNEFSGVNNFAVTNNISYVPTDISGLVAYFKVQIDTIVESSGKVSAWHDSNGGTDLAQSTDGYRPIYANGEITFDGTDDFLTKSLTNFITSNGCSIFVVAKPITSAKNNYEQSLVSQNAWPGINFCYAEYLACLDGSVDLTVSATVGVYSLMEVSFTGNTTGSTKKLSKNGGTISSNTLSGNLTTSETLRIASLNSSYFGKVAIKEILIYNKELTDFEKGKIRTYLNTKYTIY